MMTAVHMLSALFPPSSAAISENRDRGIAVLMSGLPTLFMLTCHTANVRNYTQIHFCSQALNGHILYMHVGSVTQARIDFFCN